jgi:hypothetical protein
VKLTTAGTVFSPYRIVPFTRNKSTHILSSRLRKTSPGSLNTHSLLQTSILVSAVEELIYARACGTRAAKGYCPGAAIEPSLTVGPLPRVGLVALA